ncbi:glycosyl hydrolase [Kineococcus sp. SYSU DK005]|uniref:glycosyl hydrolase n=1 Tax=Kineococcus sp. SYSU DK005 TaxID=3383126 RepID=UPI003D7EFD50
MPDPVPALDGTSLAAPPSTVRPKYRWWVPLAHVEDEELRAEVAQMAAAGAGGVEVAPFAVPGEGNRDAAFLSTYGWGTALWRHKLQVVLAAAAEHGLSVDQNLGPNYPPTVPSVADVNHPAAAQQLLHAAADVGAGARYDQPVPAPAAAAVPAGAKTILVAVLAVRAVNGTVLPAEGTSRLLERSSLVDLTARVVGGRLTWTAPRGRGTWVILAFHQTADGLAKSGYTATTPNYVVDHLSSTGARALTDFWDEHVLTPQTRRLIGRLPSPGAIFEDSLELGSNQAWTWDFSQRFAALRGYPVTAALPALTGIGAQGTAVPAFDFSDGSGARYRQDYRQTWSDLYIDCYVAHLQRWAAGHGMNYRAQPYGNPIRTGAASRVVGVPEGESINFGSPNPLGAEQDYKVVAGGAHSVGTTRISAECSGIFNGAYRSTVAGRDLNQDITGPAYVNGDAQSGQLDTTYKAYAGGATQLVWHGFAYRDAPAGLATPNSGAGGAWPGYDPWNIRGYLNVSELLGPRLPQWEDHRSVNDHLSRLQLVLKQGTPRFDLAVYYQDLGLAGHAVSPQDQPQHMLGLESATAAAGYTYEYLPPEALGRADGRDGLRLPGGAHYDALVLNDQTTMPVEALEQVVDLARRGLPVFVVGNVPAAVAGTGDRRQDARVRSLLTRLLAQRSARRVGAEADLPRALRAAGLIPAVRLPEPTTALETVRRRTEEADYYFLYNRSRERLDTTVTVTGRGRPHRVDTWGGTLAPLATYRADDRGQSTLSTPLQLAPYDVTVLTLVRGKRTGAGRGERHVLADTRAEQGEARYGQDGALLWRATHAGATEVVLDDGTPHRVSVDQVAPVPAPTSWTLSIESWTPGARSGETSARTLAPITLTPRADGSLPAWNEVPGHPELAAVSGIGRYATSIDLPTTWSPADGAYLDLGSAVDTVRVRVNGHDVAGLNQSDLSRIDLGPHLRAGRNEVVVTVATTLYNAVEVTGGSTYRLPAQRVGLLGPIVLHPYVDVHLD